MFDTWVCVYSSSSGRETIEICIAKIDEAVVILCFIYDKSKEKIICY